MTRAICSIEIPAQTGMLTKSHSEWHIGNVHQKGSNAPAAKLEAFSLPKTNSHPNVSGRNSSLQQNCALEKNSAISVAAHSAGQNQHPSQVVEVHSIDTSHRAGESQAPAMFVYGRLHCNATELVLGESDRFRTAPLYSSHPIRRHAASISPWISELYYYHKMLTESTAAERRDTGSSFCDNSTRVHAPTAEATFRSTVSWPYSRSGFANANAVAASASWSGSL